MKRAFLALATAAALATGVAHAAANDVDGTFGRLDHVFLIMMENQTNTDILGNPNLPFINSYVNVANFASDYFAVGHPSAPNYLEIIGGSNFGLTNDYWPNWVGTGCTDNAPGSTGASTPLRQSPILASIMRLSPRSRTH
jgi:phosphatidylinositol-3-phosphatase